MATHQVRRLHREPPAWLPGDRLRMVRRSLEMSQAEFATQIKVGHKALASYESGLRGIPQGELNRIAALVQRVYGFPSGWLVTGNLTSENDPSPVSSPRADSNRRHTAYNSVQRAQMRDLVAA